VSIFFRYCLPLYSMQDYDMTQPQPLSQPFDQLVPPPHHGSPDFLAQPQYFSDLQNLNDPSGTTDPPHSSQLKKDPQPPLVLTQCGPQSPMHVFVDATPEVVIGTKQAVDPFAHVPVHIQEDVPLGWFGEVGARIGLSPGWFVAVVSVAAVTVLGGIAAAVTTPIIMTQSKTVTAAAAPVFSSSPPIQNAGNLFAASYLSGLSVPTSTASESPSTAPSSPAASASPSPAASPSPSPSPSPFTSSTTPGMGSCYTSGDDGACNSANGGGTCSSSYYCMCNPGFTGYQCQTNSTDIVSGLGQCVSSLGCNSANGGGTCHSYNYYYSSYYYYCLCNTGFTGTHCETGSNGTAPGLGYCTTDASCNSAKGGGTCQTNACVCNPGFSGYQCETSITGTISGLGFCYYSSACNGANAGGTCTSETCVCNAGFIGNQCETNNTAPGMGSCNYGGDDGACNSANGGGTCSSSYYCMCNPGFTGYQCQTSSTGTLSGLGECVSSLGCNSANGGGTCNQSGYTQYCVCNAGFTGTHCETGTGTAPGLGYCTSDASCNSVNGGGTCQMYTCICNPGFSGYQCENSSTGTISGLGFCFSPYACNAANGGGTCTSETCLCNAGFTGNHCEISPPDIPSPSLYCWSNAQFSCLPQLVELWIPAGGYVAVVSGYQFTGVLLANGMVYMWGLNTVGQLGLGDATVGTTTTTPMPVSFPTGTFLTQLVAGYGSCAAIDNAENLYMWGGNAQGECGIGNTANQHQPAHVGSGYTAVALGGYNTCGLQGTALYCWGWNVYCLVGNSGSIATTPVLFSALPTVSAVALGQYSAVALLPDGTVVVWGGNPFGELGQGYSDSNLHCTPIPLSLPANATQVTAGLLHACALVQGGAAYCWGYNGNGEVGDGTVKTYPTPTLVSGLSNVTLITAGYRQTQAVVSGTTVYGWGYSLNCASSYTPTPSVSLPSVFFISSGFASQGGCAW